MRLFVLFFCGLLTVLLMDSATCQEMAQMITAPRTAATPLSVGLLTERQASRPIYRGIPIRGPHDTVPNESEKNEKTYLLLGDGESLRQGYKYSEGKKYHFEMEWGNWGRRYAAELGMSNSSDSDLLYPPKTYRPVWKISDQVVICRFDFPLTRLDIPTDKETATIVSHPDPLAITDMTLDVAVNGKKDGFTVHLSHDEASWFSPEEKSFRDFFPCRTIYFRFAAENIESFKISLDAELAFAIESPDLERTGYSSQGGSLGMRPYDAAPIAGKTLYANRFSLGADDKPVRLLDCFIDESNGLCMILENKSLASFDPFFGFGHITASRYADGAFRSAPMPAQSVCAVLFPKGGYEPGSNTLTTGLVGVPGGGIQCTIYVDSIDPSAEKPPALIGALVRYKDGNGSSYFRHFTDGAIAFEDDFSEGRFTWPKTPSPPVTPPVTPGTVYGSASASPIAAPPVNVIDLFHQRRPVPVAPVE